MKPTLQLLALILILSLAACSNETHDPTSGDIHRQGKVPDGGMGAASGGN